MYSIDNIYNIFKECSYVETDSRKVKSGALFFALKGENFDGNKYAHDAILKGASYAIIDDKSIPEHNKLIFVENALKALQQLAKYHAQQLKKHNTKILGITGSNGKTTTKELIAKVLSEKYKINFTQGNFNNHIGVPLTILGFSPEIEIGIVEMGANHPGEIKELCEIALPNIGLITSIGNAHLEGFKSIDGVKKTKAELFDFVNYNKGEIVVNMNNEYIEEIQSKYSCKKIFYGKNTSISGTYSNDSFYLHANILDNKKLYRINTKLVGNYNIDNVLAAYCIGTQFNIESEAVINAIESYIPANNRSQYIQTEKNKILLDAYNANPGSMQAALSSFLDSDTKEKLVILGQMNELGESSQVHHQTIINLLESSETEAFLVGTEYLKCKIPKSFKVYKNTLDLLKHLKTDKLSGKNILIKGSRSNKLEDILPIL